MGSLHIENIKLMKWVMTLREYGYANPLHTVDDAIHFLDEVSRKQCRKGLAGDILNRALEREVNGGIVDDALQIDTGALLDWCRRLEDRNSLQALSELEKGIIFLEEMIGPNVKETLVYDMLHRAAERLSLDDLDIEGPPAVNAEAAYNLINVAGGVSQ